MSQFMNLKTSSIMFLEDDLPVYFSDEVLLGPLKSETASESSSNKRFNPSLGLLNKLRSGLKRIIRKWIIQLNEPPAYYTESIALFMLWEGLSKVSAIDLGWSDHLVLSRAAEVLANKYLYIWTGFYKEMNKHPLLPPTEKYELVFYQPLVDKVLAYQASIERPTGTFEDKKSRDLAVAMKAYPKEACPVCLRRRHMYCGDCGGVRMPIAGGLLPLRISLPFDVMLVLHWHETLHKCTGVHAAVLSTEGIAGHFLWTKDEISDPANENGPKLPMWAPFVLSLDSERDILLFPSNDSIAVNDFDWYPVDESIQPKRYRLIVLEATWGNAKGMARTIAIYRSSHGFPPLRCVRLDNVVGQYWRFHEEGNSALSTIEAIAHTAAAAGLEREDFDKLLILFRVQKGRVLLAMEDENWKTPRAVCTTGCGDGSWTHLKTIPLPSEVST